MDEKNREIITGPDENGVRYYSIEGEEKGADPSGTGQNAGSAGNGRFGRKKPLIIFGCILVGVILLAILFGNMDLGKKGNYADLDEDHISVLYIKGTIQGDDSSDSFSESSYNHKWVLDRLDDIIDNPANKGLILFVDTPGGGVYETDEIYCRLLKYKETGRPLYSAMGSMAASGGYYISAPADKIVANRNCWTGSIGVTIGTIYDVSQLLEKYGVNCVTITSGKNKAMGSSVEPLTKEQKEIFQSLVDEAYDQFVGIVAQGRHMPVSKVKKLADGRIYTAKQAVQHGLVDQIGTLEDAVEDMKQTYSLEACQINEMEYENSSLFNSVFGSFTSGLRNSQGDVTALLQLMEQQGEVPVTYMSEIRK